MIKRVFGSIMVMVLLLLGGQVGWALPVPPPEPPPTLPPIWPDDGLRIAYQRVDVSIEDQVATTHIDQLFVNESGRMLEGQYFFPLPVDAAVSQLTMWVDGVAIEAKILGKDEARTIYDEIVRQLRDPALLEYVGQQAIQANVFPIPPQDERRIEIEYSQVLPVDNGVVHYVYPQSTDLYSNSLLENQSIRVTVRSDEALRAIYSPSHAVAINRSGDFEAVVGYEAQAVTADTDFELYYTVAQESIGLNLLSYKESGQDGFFLLLVAPALEVEEVVAKDVILVMDTSGSMEGEKMAQAQAAAAYVVEHLNPEDRFNIIAFSTGTRHYAEELVMAENPGAYSGFISGLEAIGGTNISQALLEAVDLADGQRPTTILFLTDGLATEGIVETPALLSAMDGVTSDNVRLFAFGVGDDVDTTLLDSLTQDYRGTTTYVRPFQAIDEEVSSFYAKMSSPVLADIHLDYDNIVVEQLYPATLPDLFAGTQLVLVGRYREGGPATITLRGMVNGREQVFTYEDNRFRNQGGDEFIPRLWATRAVGHLLTQIRLHGEDPELVQSVVNLSIRYGIITPYTSYLIEEDDIFSQTARNAITDEVLIEAEADSDAVSGFEAVEEAAMAGGMAEAPVAPPIVAVATATPWGTPSAAGEPSTEVVYEPVRIVGNKTFVQRDGVWIDTAFDKERHEAQLVGFASDTYFELLSRVPELGQYLALGEAVLFVLDELAYEIGATDGETAVILPEPVPVESRVVSVEETAVASPPPIEENTIPPVQQENTAVIEVLPTPTPWSAPNEMQPSSDEIVADVPVSEINQPSSNVSLPEATDNGGNWWLLFIVVSLVLGGFILAWRR